MFSYRSIPVALLALAEDVLQQRPPADRPDVTPSVLAMELMRYLRTVLMVKRERDSGERGPGPAVREDQGEEAAGRLAALSSVYHKDMSPSVLVDRLWGAVLLDTKLRRALEGVVGGEVEHDPDEAGRLTAHLMTALRVTRQSAERLAGDVLAARQLNALNAIVRFGATPRLQLWREPGTPMEAVREVAACGEIVYVLDSLPDAHRRAWRELVRRGLIEFGFRVEPGEGGRVELLYSLDVRLHAVRVQMQGGPEHTIRGCTARDDVSDLIHRVSVATGVPSAQIKLASENGWLRRGQLLYECSIGDGYAPLRVEVVHARQL